MHAPVQFIAATNGAVDLRAVMVTRKSFQRDSTAKACISKPEHHPSIRCDRSYEDHEANPASFKQQREFLVSERLGQCLFYGFIGVGRDTEQAGLEGFPPKQLCRYHVYPACPLVEICRIVLSFSAREERKLG